LQVCEERQHVRRAEFSWVFIAVEAHKPDDLASVRLVGPLAEVAYLAGIPKLGQ